MIRKLTNFILSLAFIVLAGFIIVVNAPGNPVQTILHNSGENSNASATALTQQQLSHRLGLDLPSFYFSIHALAEPDTFYRIYPESERETLQRLYRQYGNWNTVSDYYKNLKFFQQEVIAHRLKNNEQQFDKIEKCLAALLNFKGSETGYDASILNGDDFKQVTAARSNDDILSNAYQELLHSWQKLKQCEPNWRNYIPVISFDAKNRFQQWMFGNEYSNGVLKGDFGISYTTQQPVWYELLPKIKWSLFITFTALLISVLIAFPLGVFVVKHPQSFLNRVLQVYYNLAFAAPVFWVATLLLFLFANQSFLRIFPAYGVQPLLGFDDENMLSKIFITAWHLVLPLICYSYSSIALLAYTLQHSLSDVMKQDFIRTAFSKGLSLKQVINRHALRNAILPLVTLISNFFPAAIAGSVIIENIFSIPGMGNAIVNSVYTQNYPVLVAILILTGFFTLAGYLLADLVYRMIDPRIKFNNGN